MCTYICHLVPVMFHFLIEQIKRKNHPFEVLCIPHKGQSDAYSSKVLPQSGQSHSNTSVHLVRAGGVLAAKVWLWGHLWATPHVAWTPQSLSADLLQAARAWLLQRFRSKSTLKNPHQQLECIFSSELARLNQFHRHLL